MRCQSSVILVQYEGRNLSKVHCESLSLTQVTCGAASHDATVNDVKRFWEPCGHRKFFCTAADRKIVSFETDQSGSQIDLTLRHE